MDGFQIQDLDFFRYSFISKLHCKPMLVVEPVFLSIYFGKSILFKVKVFILFCYFCQFSFLILSRVDGNMECLVTLLHTRLIERSTAAKRRSPTLTLYIIDI